MKIIGELAPNTIVKEVSFEDRLLGLEFRGETAYERERVDVFWSNLHYAYISASERALLAADDVMLEGLCVYPSDYSLAEKTVSVIIASTLSRNALPGRLPGPTAYARLTIEGAVSNEQGAHSTYSSVFRPHVANLLAETALAYQPIETDCL